MNNIFNKFKDNVIFIPIKNNLNIRYFVYRDNYILISTNINECFNILFDKRFILCNCDNEKKIIGNITIIYDEHIFAQRYDYSNYDENAFIKKSHPMYIEGVFNNSFEINDTEIHIYHYPRGYFNLLSKKSLNFFSLVGTKTDISLEFNNGIKKILSRYNYKLDIYTLHGAAISYSNRGYIFLSGSHSGKSSLFINLIDSETHPINDDIIFWSVESNKIYIHGCGILPHLRKNAFEKVKCTKKLSKIDFNNEYIISDLIQQTTYEDMIELKALFVPEIGYNTTEIFKIDYKTILRKILRACMVHGNYEINESFLTAFNLLTTYPIYKLNMSNDYEEICSSLKNFIAQELQ